MRFPWASASPDSFGSAGNRVYGETKVNKTWGFKMRLLKPFEVPECMSSRKLIDEPNGTPANRTL